MLLAAGRGERMGELTRHHPKPLLEIAGKPLIEHHITRLAAAGFRDIVINTAYLGDQIRDYLQDGHAWQVNIQYTEETQRLETGGGILNALPLLTGEAILGDAPFLVVNSDVWTDFPYQSIPKKITGKAHLVMVPNPSHHTEGDFVLKDAQGDKPSNVCQGAGPRHTFSGISVLTPSLFGGSSAGAFPLAPLLRAAMDDGQVSGELYCGYWVDVGTPQRLQQVAVHEEKM